MTPARQPPLEPVAPAHRPHNLFVGTSGWAYPTWKPGFYPEKLPQRQFLTYFASQLTAVEVNYTFRALPTPKMLADWLGATPPSFRLSFKFPQRITHFSRLRDAAAATEQFLLALQPIREAGRLGTLLVQLPPNFQADLGRLAGFLVQPALRGAEAPQLCFEFRHRSWLEESTFALLRDHNAALCVAHAGDKPGDLEVPEVHTAATHTSFRLRRSGGYSAAELAEYAAKFTALAREREVYVALRHQDEPTGALNARDLLALAAALEPGPTGADSGNTGAAGEGARS